MTATPITASELRQGHAWSLVVGLAYGVLALITGNAPADGDEIRYLEHALNFTQGYFLPVERPELLNGPGYPLILLPLVKMGAPMLVLRLLNAVAAGVGFLWFWKLGRQFIQQHWALAFALLTMCHPVLMRQGGQVMTEVITQALVGGAALLMAYSLHDVRWKWRPLLRAMIALGVLTMTKVIFGHVMSALLVFSLLAILLVKGWRTTARKVALICAGGLLCCAPYLVYTHGLTGQWFKWSTSGGELMYWLTSHHPGENGHWYPEDWALVRSELAPNHAEFIHRVVAAGPLQADSLYGEKVKEHLQEPSAVLYNYLCNWCRMFFGFPRSFEYERLSALAPILVNGLLLLSMACAAILGWLRREQLPQSLLALLIMGLIYTGGSSLAPSQPRYFITAFPLLLLPTLRVLSQVPWRALVAR
jgi:hypothetical protein